MAPPYSTGTLRLVAIQESFQGTIHENRQGFFLLGRELLDGLDSRGRNGRAESRTFLVRKESRTAGSTLDLSSHEIPLNEKSLDVCGTFPL